MTHAATAIAVILLTTTSAFGQSNATYQRRAGSNTQHKNGSTSATHVNAGLKKEAGIEAGFFTGNDKTNERTIGRNRDEKWFLGIRGGARAGAAVDAGASHTVGIDGTPVRTYVEGEAFVGVEADAQAGVSNTGAGVNAGAFAGARVSGKAGTEVGPVDTGVTGEAWAGVGAEAGAEVTYKNGEFGFDYGAGAAIGVGGKVGGSVSVDAGGAINGAKKVGSKINSTSRSATKTAKKAGATTKKAANVATKSTKKATKSVKKAGKSATKSRKKARKTVKKAGKSAKKKLKKLF